MKLKATLCITLDLYLYIKVRVSCVRLLFAAEQVACSGFLQLFSLRVNQNSKVVAGQISNE